MATFDYLGGKSGVQYDGIQVDEDANGVDLQNVLLVGEFKRGPLNRPFKVTKETMEAKLSFDYNNPYYTFLEDAFAHGAEYIWVMRVANRQVVPVPPNEKPLESFDYAVFRYIWTGEGGGDLDTRTRISNPARPAVVGWNREYFDEEILKWSGDNTGVGIEAVLLNMSELKRIYPTQNVFEVDFKAFWYSVRYSGNFQLQVETYKGGTMRQDDAFNFINEGGSRIQTLLIDCSIPEDTTNREGFLIATLKYDAALKKGTLTRVADPGNPPARQLSLSTHGTLLFSGNPDNLVLENSNNDVIYSHLETGEELSLRDSSNQILF